MEDIYQFINKNINFDVHALQTYNALNVVSAKHKFPYNLLQNDIHSAVSKLQTLKLGGSVTIFTF